ncbi:MAG: hypothetical protein QM689_07580 [Oscillospiraceae bacterium]
MQLLKITTTPIEYEFKIEKPSFVESKEPVINRDKLDFATSDDANNRPRSDATELEKPKAAAPAGTTTDYTQNAKNATAGKSLTVADYYRNKVVADNLSATLTNDSAAQMDSDALSDIRKAWDSHKKEMEFVPGKFQMDIIHLSEVNIEYVGDPLYVPPSAAPDYEKE